MTPYTIRFLPPAPQQVRHLPPEVRAVLPIHLTRLAQHPVALSMPGAPPASLPNRLIFTFPVAAPGGPNYSVRVHFRYGQDEQTLWVVAVTAVPHP